MKKLYSKFHKSGWTAKNGVTYPVRCLSLKTLWPWGKPTHELYGKPFLENLKQDILSNGLHFPTLCISVSRKILKVKKRQMPDRLNDLPFDPETANLEINQYVIRGGCQRYYVAAELGYTHIDCAIIPDLNTAYTLQRQMRKPFQKKYYSRVPLDDK